MLRLKVHITFHFREYLKLQKKLMVDLSAQLRGHLIVH